MLTLVIPSLRFAAQPGQMAFDPSADLDLPGLTALLGRGEQLVVFPEGRIHRDDEPLRLHQGLARLAQLAGSQGVAVTVLPVGIAYGRPVPGPGDRAAVQIGAPLRVDGEGREAGRRFTAALTAAMGLAEAQARALVGRPLLRPQPRPQGGP